MAKRDSARIKGLKAIEQAARNWRENVKIYTDPFLLAIDVALQEYDAIPGRLTRSKGRKS